MLNTTEFLASGGVMQGPVFESPLEGLPVAFFDFTSVHVHVLVPPDIAFALDSGERQKRNF